MTRKIGAAASLLFALFIVGCEDEDPQADRAGEKAEALREAEVESEQGPLEEEISEEVAENRAELAADVDADVEDLRDEPANTAAERLGEDEAPE